VNVLLVPAHPGFPRQIPQSRKTVVVVVVVLVIFKDKGAVLGVNLGHPIVVNGDFVTWLFPNYFGQDLFYIVHLC